MDDLLLECAFDRHYVGNTECMYIIYIHIFYTYIQFVANEATSQTLLTTFLSKKHLAINLVTF